MSHEYIKHGPTFGGRTSGIGFTAFAISFLLMAILSQTPLFYVFVFLVLFFFIMFMNYQGVEIDYKNKKIRLYESYLGWKHGQWHDMGKFEKVVLYFLTSTTSVSFDSIDSDFHSKSYTIELIGKTKKHKIELNEIMGYTEAMAFAKKYALKLDKPFVNVIEVALQNKNPDYYRHPLR